MGGAIPSPLIGQIVLVQSVDIYSFVIRIGEKHKYGQLRSKLIGTTANKRTTQPSAKILFKSSFSMINIKFGQIKSLKVWMISGT